MQTMHVVVNNEDMERIDNQTIRLGTPGITLMTRAGEAVFHFIHDQLEKMPVVVLAGPGNNGGDGYVIAEYLLKEGWEVSVFAIDGMKPKGGDALKAAEAYSADVSELTAAIDCRGKLVVDALFGTGLDRPIEDELADAVRAINAQDATVIAVDIPSGVNGTSGKILGCAIKADYTITFCRKKRGHALLPGRACCGEVVVADIGMSDETVAAIARPVFENHPDLWMEQFPFPALDTHKYKRGYTAVVGGDESTGAARLAAKSALRIGSGLVSVLSSPDSVLIYASALTSVMVKQLDKSDIDGFMKDARINSWLIGPGAGLSDITRKRTLKLAASKQALVLDADALSVFEDDPHPLIEQLHECVVITPHQGEFDRFFSQTDITLGVNPISSVREAAQYCGCVVALKGPDTIVAAPDGRVVINNMAPPYLATAGSGDVLAGLCAGLQAQGMNAFEAACAATWIHSQAANLFGIGLISEDLPELIPEVLAELELLSL